MVENAAPPESATWDFSTDRTLLVTSLPNPKLEFNLNASRVKFRIVVRFSVNPKLNLMIIISLVRCAVQAKINVSRIDFRLTITIKIRTTWN